MFDFYKENLWTDFIYKRPHGVTVRKLDSGSGDRGPNPRGAFGLVAARISKLASARRSQA